MPIQLDFKNDPSTRRVVIHAILIMIGAFLSTVKPILLENRAPTNIELFIGLVIALEQLVAYITTWLKKEETEETT